MPPIGSLPRDASSEKRVWHLLTEDFYWSRKALEALRVGVRSPIGAALGEEVRLQPFEVVVAAVFAAIRPDYDWWVTPNLPDGGVDFIGRGVFLASEELGIDAAITIGGQCKKRERVDDIVGELSGSFVRMAKTLHPTLFVAALSASLKPKRVAEAREILEHTLNRHCHILERGQLESLIADNLSSAEPILRRAFSPEDAALVLNYFERRSGGVPLLAIESVAPPSVLAGEPFSVRLQLAQSSISDTALRLRWRPPPGRSSVTLVAPSQAQTTDGFEVKSIRPTAENPFLLEIDLEFLLYAVGTQILGAIEVRSGSSDGEPISIAPLPPIHVVENLRPPFYGAPYRRPMDEIWRGFERAQTGKVCCVAVSGAGGAGKTRLCEEVSLEARRRGARVLTARQAHSTEVPRRILANLLLALADSGSPRQTPADRVDSLLLRLEPALARRARPAVRALCEQAGRLGSFEDDQALLSVLAVLIVQRARTQPVIIHLHDLHWCTLDVLDVVDRLIWQLGHLKSDTTAGGAKRGLGVLFLLEGRLHEHRAGSDTGWSTRIFERFMERLDCPVARCRAFEPQESLTFAHRLFEQPHSANRMLPEPLLGLQRDLVDSLHKAAGGNPFHLIEQVKLLLQHGVLGQNPRTGFVYMVKPQFSQVRLSTSVLQTIEARWRYYWVHEKELALLLWAAALVDDNLPAPLFDHLWRHLASGISKPRIEGTEFLRFPLRGQEGGLHVSFRHENYFRTVRDIQLPEDDRLRVVGAYSEWFKSAKRLSPALRHVQAKVALEAPSPDLRVVRRTLRAAYRSAVKRQDHAVAARALATLLDGVTWPSHGRKPLRRQELVKACEEELALCRILVRSGQTEAVLERLAWALEAIEQPLLSPSRSIQAFDPLRAKRFALLTLKAQVLFHNRQPGDAVGITERALQELGDLLTGLPPQEQDEWRAVAMGVHHTHSTAVAFAGDLKLAVQEARKAAEIAESLLDTDPDALEVLITSANILLCEVPEESEATLERHLAFADQAAVNDGTRLRLQINLAMARILRAYRKGRSKDRMESRLEATHDSLLLVFRRAFPLGRLKDAAAAALLLGLIHALRGNSDEVDWFSQAAALSVRSRQLETLWRAHINLAHALDRYGQSAHDAAAAALELMTESLSTYAEPDRSPRFDLISVPMAHAVRYLTLAGDERARLALRAFPELRRMFSNLESGTLKDDRAGRSSHEWFRVGMADYVLY